MRWQARSMTVYGILAAKGAEGAAGSRKRNRGTPAGADILLRMPDNTWKPFRKPVILRKEERRQNQLKDIVRMFLENGIEVTVSNLARLGLGRGPVQRRMLQAIAEDLLKDDTATDNEKEWAQEKAGAAGPDDVEKDGGAALRRREGGREENAAERGEKRTRRTARSGERKA